ncbi:hypothetical protein CP10139811_1012 [Chlamydia ibidis]|uniref:UPF0235 protein CP10139811_1012 n=2 Tax=Chlamydia ibidis TaxID=1405396 RepID=S7J5R3_9CHLA|nr:DUF167 family protein [Chlamydia ibidis]EPP35427.1 hypothetical protein CP10139811_1012 [Chlamydia ibidis]EQM63085.1 hypothetical protein H359_0330 [Chlamydia ibidis 10-1398/6]
MSDEFWILEVKVTPKAKENKVLGFEGDVLKVRVTDPPDKGKANDAVVSVLAKALSLPKRDVTLVSGETSRRKKILLPKSIQTELFKRYGKDL